jgi:acetamidase/formamidase
VSSGGRTEALSLSVAARAALEAMIEHLTAVYELSPEAAYILCSVAGDVHVAQMVNAPNAGVTVSIPEDCLPSLPR